jgi:hypothetical protein
MAASEYGAAIFVIWGEGRMERRKWKIENRK